MADDPKAARTNGVQMRFYRKELLDGEWRIIEHQERVVASVPMQADVELLLDALNGRRGLNIPAPKPEAVEG